MAKPIESELHAAVFFFKFAADAVDFMSKIQTYANITGSEGTEAAEKILLRLNLSEFLEVTPIRNGMK